MNVNAEQIVEIINNNGVVLMQTDTIFGLICDGTNDVAIRKIETIKHRNKPSFGFFVKDINMASQYAKMNDIQNRCFQHIFPGHFTLILEASDYAIRSIPQRALGKTIDNNKNNNKNNENSENNDENDKKTCNQISTIGLRIPDNKFCLEVLSLCDKPLLATSANISGKQAPKEIAEVEKSILEKVDAICYDETNKMAGLNSTIVDITDTKNAKVIRQGSGDIKKVLETGILLRQN